MRGVVVLLLLVVPIATTVAFHQPSSHHLPLTSIQISQTPSINLNHNIHYNSGTTSRKKTTELHSKPPSSSEQERKKKQRRGVYARPSAAIEQGSGFFVPGLEGSRVRILFGFIVLLLNTINMSLFDSVNAKEVVALSALGFSAKVSTFFGVLLLIQGSVELAKELGLGIGSFDISTNSAKVNKSSNKVPSIIADSTDDDDDSKYLKQVISPSLNAAGDDDTTNTAGEATSWAAASYVALALPATHVMLLELKNDQQQQEINDNSDSNSNSNGTILYSLGNFLSSQETTNSLDEEETEIVVQEGIRAAIQTVHESKGGRVSIPATHPASISLLPEGYRRCVLLQKVEMMEEGGAGADSRKVCLLVGSDQLLQAYSKNDLKWLGRFGKYLSLRI